MPDSHDLKQWLDSASRASADPGTAAKWVREANGRGEHVLAISFAARVLEAHGDKKSGAEFLALRQQFALAFARSGSADAALGVLRELHEEGFRDAETLGLLGRVQKDLAEKFPDLETRRGHLEKSRGFYSEGFERHGDTYCGINAAALSVFTGRIGDAKALAERVLGLCGEGGDMWGRATAAEALMILGRLDEARSFYLEAAAMAGARRADFASTLKQCRKLGAALGGGAERIAGDLPRGAVAVFAGHRPDLPGRKKPRLPAEALDGLRDRILAWMRANDIRVVYSSAAAGADLVFLECARELDLERHVYLPYPREDFLKRSVEDCGADWVARFESAVSGADTLTVVDDQIPEDDGAALRFCIRLLTAAASSMAGAVDWPLRPLAVWDGLPAAGPGGTADSVAFWNSSNFAVDILHPLECSRDGVKNPLAGSSASVPFSSIYASHPEGVGSEIAVPLALHVAGYEKLADGGFVSLDRDVFGGVADLLAARGWSGRCEGGFGDYVFFWDSISGAGDAALEILNVLQRGAAERGLDVRFSMCLHVAPMQTVVNPLLNVYSHEGRAAVDLRDWARRLPPGVVHATGRFANLATLERSGKFSCSHAGSMDSRGEPFGVDIHRLQRA